MKIHSEVNLITNSSSELFIVKYLNVEYSAGDEEKLIEALYATANTDVQKFLDYMYAQNKRLSFDCDSTDLDHRITRTALEFIQTLLLPNYNLQYERYRND